MTISSRTPEGTPHPCPVCAGVICIEPSQPAGDVPCPQCGALLWFFALPGDMRLYNYEDVPAGKREKIATLLETYNVIGEDSLNMVELVMELEEQFGTPFGTPFDEKIAREIQSVGDAIDYLIRQEES